MFEHPLEERCHEFGKRVRRFCRKLKLDIMNAEDVRQLVRASGSVGANYIEANENVSNADLKFRLKLCRKESKESVHFLGLLEVFGDEPLNKERNELADEANQLRKIFSSMIVKIEGKDGKKVE
jgi:four helix bundle protein